MPMPIGLSHVAMSVPPGTLNDEYRAEVVDFYGGLLGWRDIESLRLPDRMTLAVGGHTYVNIRERPEVMVCHGYEHLGVVVESAEEAERLWAVLDDESREVNLQPLDAGEDAYRSFRFHYLLPLAIEVQFFP